MALHPKVRQGNISHILDSEMTLAFVYFYLVFIVIQYLQ